jgi:bacillithiol system protein YtxJ
VAVSPSHIRISYDFALNQFKIDGNVMAFVEIQTQQQLEEFLAAANGGPAILFKHSDSCGISARAYRDMSQLAQQVGIITVQNARDLSSEIERRFNLPHETPQALIVRNNQVVWNASHGRVRASVIEEAMADSSK